MGMCSKETWKVLRSCLQWVFLIAVSVYIVQLFIERGASPQFDRESWTQRDGFTAIAYSSLTREENTEHNSRQQFERHVLALEKAGYNWITTNDVIRFYRDNQPLPEKALYLMMEGGRKDTVIFGQQIMDKTGVYATLFTTINTMKSWNNFFVTKANVAALAKSAFWGVGSQGLGLMPINENMPNVTPSYFLTDFLRDPTGLPKETDEQMRARLAEYYKESFEPLSKLTEGLPLAFVMMPSNSFNSSMPYVVEEANRKLAQQYFQMAFTREGTSFNSAVDDMFELTRMQVKPDWTDEHLIEVLGLATVGRMRFSVAEGDTANNWISFRTGVEIQGQDIVLTPRQGRADPVILRGSSLWDNVLLSMTIEQKEGVDRYVYLRYDTPNDYLRLTLQGARVLVQERVPGQGLYTIADEIIPSQPPWKFNVLLKGNRIRVMIGDRVLGSGFLPVSPALRFGAVALGMDGVEGAEGHFGSLNIMRIPSVWRIESATSAAPVAAAASKAGPVNTGGAKQGHAKIGEAKPDEAEATLPALQDPTASVVPLAEGGADAAKISRQVLRARSEGNMAIAALAPGVMALDEHMLVIAPFSLEQSRKLWDGIMVQPLAQSSWSDVAATLSSISTAGYRSVVRLSRDAAMALASSDVTLSADYYLLDFMRAEIPTSIWTSLAHRHNRNHFLYATAEGGVLYAAGGK